MMGERLTLEPGEAYLCSPRMAYTQPDIRIGELTYQLKGQLPSFGGFGADSANTVSYTHLDVYKRQVLPGRCDARRLVSRRNRALRGS